MFHVKHLVQKRYFCAKRRVFALFYRKIGSRKPFSAIKKPTDSLSFFAVGFPYYPSYFVRNKLAEQFLPQLPQAKSYFNRTSLTAFREILHLCSSILSLLSLSYRHTDIEKNKYRAGEIGGHNGGVGGKLAGRIKNHSRVSKEIDNNMRPRAQKK